MATTPMDDRTHLDLKPMWTPHFDFGILPGGSPLKSNRSHIFSPSPRSPKTLPTPVLPSVSYDGVMRQHERSLVERLDQRIRQTREGSEAVSPVASAANSRPISPVEQPPADMSNQKRLPSIFIPNGGNARGLGLLPPTPASPATTFPRRQTIVSETRSMLLAGLGDDTDRRQSVPVNRARLDASKLRETIHLEQLRVWGPSHLGDTKSADVFVQAISLRRPSEISSSSCSEASSSASSSPQMLVKHATVRARVRPRDIERKHFVIQREFDIEQLRASIPDPLPAGYVPRSPVATQSAQFQRASPLAPHAHRRGSVVRPGLHAGRRGSLADGRRGSIVDARSVLRGTKAVPIRTF